MKKFRVIRKDSGLKSGSREVSLTEALKYPVYNPVQRKFIYHEALKLSNPVQNPVQGEIYLPQSFEALISGLTMSGSKRN